MLVALAFLAVWWGFFRGSETVERARIAQTQPVQAGDLPAGIRPVATTPPRTESVQPAAPAPTPVASAADASRPALEEKAMRPDADGVYRKLRLVRGEGKYPLVRVEETWRRDPATGAETLVDRVSMVGDHLLVKLNGEATEESLRAFLAQAGGSIRRHVPNSAIYLVAVPEPSLDAFDGLLERLRGEGAPVAYAEPDFVVSANFTPNDPSYGQLWGLHNAGQTGGRGDADIDAPEAWDVTRGSAAVVVGVIDTGIDYRHPDLAANMWLNAGEIPGNGIDDDGNGYIDDMRGWDFVNGDADPMDDHYHGTHCAGTIGAVGNNGIGVAGVAHTVRLMALKFLSASGSGHNSDAIEAIHYATANGATLTSNSWGGGGYSQGLKDAIDAARDAGSLFIAAAGNDGKNNDQQPSYPASYDSPNILSVAATDHADQLASFSNYGKVSVDLGAPGVAIYSTSPGSGYRSLSGTSMACPHVAGACALLVAARPSMNWSDVRTALLEHGDVLAGLSGKTSRSSRLNIARALLISTGPAISLVGFEARDDAASGAVGNGDGVINPGEDLVVRVAVKNAGGAPAEALTTQLTLASGAAPVTILQGTQTWGTLAAGAVAENNAAPFRLRIAAGTVTPHTFTVRLTSRDTAGGTWITDTELTVFTGAGISGRVTALTGGAPIAGAVIGYTGPSSGSVTTGADGTYALALTDGTYSLRAAAGGYSGSESVAVTVPPSRTGVNFALGRSKLQVTPASLTSAQLEDQITQHTVQISNTGDTPLTVSLGSSSVIASQALGMAAVSVPAIDNLGPVAPDARRDQSASDVVAQGGTVTTVPFAEGFESGSIASWGASGAAGTRTVVSHTAAVGSRSFEFAHTGPNGHGTGISRTFASGSKPRYASFWVRSGSTATSDGYFILSNGSADLIWFFATDNGRFYVNGDNGGDTTATYAAGTWYRIEFRDIDWVAKNFDYYVDGALVKSNIPMRNAASASGITNLQLYNFSTNSTAWWDDIRLSTDPVSWLSYAPASLNLSPGQSQAVTVSMNSTGLAQGIYQGRLDLFSNDPANPLTTVPVEMSVSWAPNTPPVATSETVVSLEDTAKTITLSGTDAENDVLTAVLTQLPTVGALYQTADGVALGAKIAAVPATITSALRQVIYVPPIDANGSPLAAFQFVLKDKRTQSGTATITLNVTPVNDRPTAYGDIATGLPGLEISPISVLGNDFDPDGDALSILSFTQGARGAVAANGDGTLRYTPNSGFSEGQDSFSYTITDGQGGTSTATVSVTLGYLAAGPWPTLGNGPGHPGYYPAALGAQSFVENWTINFGRSLNEVSLAEGRIFVTPSIYFNDTHVSAVDVATGTIAWRHDFVQAFSLNGPTYHRGRIYLQRGNHSSDSQLWCLEAGSGATVWSAPFLAQWETYLPPAVTDAGVFVNGGSYGGMYGFDLAGQQLFFHQLPQVDGWTPAVGANALYSCVRGVLISHNPATGARNWSYTIDPNAYSAKTVTYDAGRVYVADSTGLYAINVSGSAPAQLWKATGSFTGIPAVGNGRVFAIASTGGKVQAFDITTGAAAGEYLTGTNCWHQPIVTTDALLVAATNKVFLFDLATRALRQTINYGGKISLSNGTLVIAGYDTFLRAYRVAGGPNAAPSAQAQTTTGVEDENLTITLGGSDSDGDPLRALVTTLPARGTLYQTTDGVKLGEPISFVPVLVSNDQRQVIYRPAPDGFGAAYATFSFKVNDGTSNSAAATVTVNVTNVNDAPVAVDDRTYLRAGNILAAYLPTANDIDADGEMLQIVSFTQPARGALTQNPDGSLRYVPETGFIEGTDHFDYTLRDGAGATASASVEIVVSEAFGREWPTFGNGPDHAGRYPGSLGTSPLQLRWEYAFDRFINPLAVADGKVFCSITGNSSDFMQAAALDATTGSLVWRAQFNPGSSLNPPTYHRGTLYLQRGNHSTDSQLWALDAGDGSVKFRAPYAAQWGRYMAPAVSDLGVYVAGGSYGGIYGFDRLTGGQKFFLDLEQYDQWAPSIYEGGVYSFVSTKFRSHDPATGAVLWTLDLGGRGSSILRTVAFDSGRAYLTNQVDYNNKNELVCIDLATRSVLWRTPGTGAFTGTPAIMGGIVYVIQGTAVKAYGASAGLPLGDFVTPNEYYTLVSAPVVTGDLVFVASTTKTYIFDRISRQLLQTLPFSGQPAIVDDVVYFSCSDKKVRAYASPRAGNRAPTATPAQAGIVEEASVALRLEGTDLDGDPLRFSIRSLPAQGALFQTADGVTKGAPITLVPALVQNSQGTVIYQAPLDVNGVAAGSFTFMAHDLYSSSAPATVQIDIAPVNDAPLAIADYVALRPGEVLANFLPQLNDRDPDGDPLIVSSFTQGARGTVSQSADGTLQYAPAGTYATGTDAFDYTIRDLAGVQSTATVTIVFGATAGREWPTFGAGPEHAGYVPLYLGTDAFAQRWSNNLGKAAHQLAVADGRIFASLKIYSQDSSLVALDASAGGELWRVNFTGGAYMNPPTTVGDSVFMQYSNSSNSRLYAFDTAGGSTRWSSPFSAQWEEYFAPAVDAAGVFVNAGTYGGLYGFHPTTGAQLFFNGLEQYDEWTPALYQGGLYAFVKGKFTSHDKATGATLWTLDFGWNWGGYSMGRTIACADGRAFLVNDSVTIPSGDQELIAVNLTAQDVTWKVRGKFKGTPAVAHRTVFALTGTDSVKAYDTATGTYLGAYVAPGETALWWQPIVTNDTLIAFSNTKTYIFDLRSRALRQTIPYGGYASLAGHSLYIASPDFKVRAFSVADPLNRPPAATPLAVDTPEDNDLAVALAGQDADGDPLSFVVTRLPTAGKLYLTADGVTRGAALSSAPALVTGAIPRVIYAPPADQHGPGLGSFGYAASDGKGLSPEATVTLSVTPVNDAPLAFADTRFIQPDQILSPIRETLNDLDVDGDLLTVVSFTQPVHGQVVRNEDGTLRYHPPQGATSGSDEFSYTIEDAAGARATAQVTVEISAVIQGLWPTFGNGPAHTGYAPTTLGRVGWIQRWSYQLGGQPNAVAIAEGKVFATSSPGGVPTVAALVEKSGEQIWKKTFANASSNPPTWHDGQLYFQRGNHSSDTQLIALHAGSGLTLWSSPHGAQWGAYLAPAVNEQGVFINGGTYGGMYGVTRASGSQMFFRSLSQTDRWTPALLGSEVFSFVNGTLTSHVPATGATAWSLSLGWGGYGYSMNRTVALQGRSAYLINDSPTPAYNDEDLVRIDLDTHAVLWSVNGDFTGTPAVSNGAVYALSGNAIQERATADGRLLGTYAAPAGQLLTGQPVVTDDLVIASALQKTYVFGRYDRQLVATFPRGGGLSVADDQLIVAGTDGTIAAYAAQPAVTFAPSGGTFAEPVDVILSAADPGSRIYYTVDGSAPGFESPWVTSGATVRVSWTGRIRAILVKGSAVSRLNEASYTMLDSDLDGLPDWWENVRFGALAATSLDVDSDGDGTADGAEFTAGTDPLDATDRFGIATIATVTGGQIEITWQTKADRIYLVEESEALGTWKPASNWITGDGGVSRFTRPLVDTKCFYRIRALPRVRSVP